MEISAGVFVGKVSARVREELWSQVVELAKDGKAIMVTSARSEQGLELRTHRHDWELADLDGLTVMRRPATPSVPRGQLRPGWSRASHRRRAR
ncbi:type I-E CRISPR-associated endoribonuclease Cas2e [Arsenicicoccus cauae]|uniref:type I-E CRISPR-associated endoribonuclease Cas2e n=1 Tax=Arsenicicoccus cauae TaxID=2663847 RepID=UPI00370D821D